MQLALANAVLLLHAGESTVGPKRSFRRFAVTKEFRNPRYDAVRVAGLDRIRFFRQSFRGILSDPQLPISPSSPLHP
jgi:hypothetical protein